VRRPGEQAEVVLRRLGGEVGMSSPARVPEPPLSNRL